MTAVARPEKAQITLEFEFWANVDTSAIDATQYVNSVLNKLPTGIKTPTVIKRDVNASPIMEISVMADKPLGDVIRWQMMFLSNDCNGQAVSPMYSSTVDGIKKLR